MSLGDFAQRRIESRWLTRSMVWHTKGTRQATLQSLLFTPEHQLRDLGISRSQLIIAMKIHRGESPSRIRGE